MVTGRVHFGLYLVTDRTQTGGRPLGEVVRVAITGGVGAVQLREKDLAAGELLALAEELHAITQAAGVPLLVNDRIDVALAVGAEGVHLPAHALPVKRARQLLGPGPLIGVSTHSLEEALLAQEEGADFLLFGPIFSTPSKDRYGSPQGLERLQALRRRVALPLFAIGGITPSNVTQLWAHGVDGVAVISALMTAADPATAARGLLAQRPAPSPDFPSVGRVPGPGRLA